MSDSDWDLYAVVKSCTTSTAASDNHHRMEEDGEKHQTYYDCPSLQNDNFASPLSYSDQNTALNCGLEEVYETFSNTSTDFGSQQVIHQPQLQEPQPHSFTLSISNPQSSAIRSRRRKNQHMKMVYQMTQEELSGDTWAWRKYGQKPIKGSPYPRNYYRCSTLKGCPARKQVERNSTDSTVFIVSYTGEHAHPRPTHRSSLAGSTRNKFSAAAALNSIIKSTTTSGGESSSAAPNFSPSTSPNSALTFSSPLIQCESIHDNTTDDAEMVDMDDDDHEEDYNDHYISKQEISDELHQLDSNGWFFD